MIHYNNYPIKTPIGTLPLGHAGVVAVDPNSDETKYYEFGRYSGLQHGTVMGPPERVVPNVVIKKDGLPTKDSLKKLYKYLAKNYGKEKEVSTEYFEHSDYKGTIEFAEEFKRNHLPYKPFTNNCKTFAKEAAKARKEDK